MDVIYSEVNSSEVNGRIFIREDDVSELLSEGINLETFFSHSIARFAFIFIRLKGLCNRNSGLFSFFKKFLLEYG